MIIEFQSDEVMNAYDGVPMSDKEADKVEVIYVINPILEEEVKIINPMGVYTEEEIQLLREQLEITTRQIDG